MRVVIGEDEVLLREGLSLVLREGAFDVVATASDPDGLLRAAARYRPDLVVTDIRMPPEHTDEGLRAALRIRSVMPQVAIVLLSQYLQRRYALELLDGSPTRVGYLLKQRIADIPTFCADLNRVCAGGTVLDPEVVALMISRARQRHGGLEGLTSRQREVLAAMAQGRSNSSIARLLHISEKAVVQHVSHIYAALDLPDTPDDHRRVHAVVRFLAGQPR